MLVLTCKIGIEVGASRMFEGSKQARLSKTLIPDVKSLPPNRRRESIVHNMDNFVENIAFKYKKSPKLLLKHLKQEGGIIGRNISAKQLQTKACPEVDNVRFICFSKTPT